jgi:hypothetical protein
VVNESSWNQNYEALCFFKEKFGHCDVPRIYAENKKLGFWVAAQCKSAKKGSLSIARRKKLDALGFKYFRIKSWGQSYKELVEYKNKFGHCNVPRGDLEYKALAIWVLRQRMMAKKNKLSKERRKKLDALGFVYSFYRERSCAKMKK